MSSNIISTLIPLNNRIRADIINSTTAAGTGHPTSSLSASEVMTSIFFGGYFQADLNDTARKNNDRLIFSKGHAAPLFYALYAAAGKITQEELLKLRQFESPLEGHPTLRFPYTEAATGSLGQGLGVGVGMALNARLDNTNYKTWVLLGDSEMAEGSIWEAMNSASYYHLSSLIGIVDMNRLGQRGETQFGHNSDNLKAKCEAFGWEVFVIEDGHNVEQIITTLDAVTMSKTDKPKMIIAKTFKGHGVSFAENKDGFHGKAFTKEQAAVAIAEIGDFDGNIIGSVAMPSDVDNEGGSKDGIKEVPFTSYSSTEKVATRKAYGNALVAIGSVRGDVVALDAEMNNSTFSNQFAAAYPTRYFEMFIAEQNMISVATGLARRGKVPFVSTFAAFLSRAFDQIRMCQYSQANIKIMGSHAGVSIGPDGSSQMAVEDLAMMRAILNSTVLYPSDAISTERLTAIAADIDGLTYIRCTRADTPLLYSADEVFEIGKSKTLRSSDNDVVTVFAAGITLHEALKAADLLAQEGIAIRVIDAYSIKPIDTEVIAKACSETKAIITVEDHYLEGGLYEAVCSSGVVTKPVHPLAVKKMSRSGTPEELLAFMEIDAQAIVKLVTEINS